MKLTKRQVEIARLLVDGHSNRDIVAKLNVTPNAVSLSVHEIKRHYKKRSIERFIAWANGKELFKQHYTSGEIVLSKHYVKKGDRRKKIIDCLAKGYSAKETASKLGIDWEQVAVVRTYALRTSGLPSTRRFIALMNRPHCQVLMNNIERGKFKREEYEPKEEGMRTVLLEESTLLVIRSKLLKDPYNQILASKW